MATRGDEEPVPLSAVVKWLAIVSVVAALILAVVTGRWLLLFSVPSAPVTLYVLQRRWRV